MRRSVISTLILLASLAACESAKAQSHAEYIRRAQAEKERQNRENQERARAKRAATIQKQRRNVAMKEHASTIAPLESPALAQWKKVSSSATIGGTYYRYDIKQNGATIAVAKYNPKIGYIVDDKAQNNGLGWNTLDAALTKRFKEKQLWGLPDIPGWSKSHLLTGEQHIAEMKREALEKAKPKAVSKIADKVADQIVEEVGPKMQDDIAGDLGLRKKNALPDTARLQFKRLGEDKDVVRYGEPGGKFELHKNKTGGEWEVLQVDGKEPKRFPEVFTSLEEAATFASVKAADLADLPAAQQKPEAAKAPAKPKGYVRNAPNGTGAKTSKKAGGSKRGG